MTLSERQYPLLAMFDKPHLIMSVAQAQAIDQRPFRSFLIRGYLGYSRVKKGFYLTETGQEAWHRFNDTSIQRKDPTQPLTNYFRYFKRLRSAGQARPRAPKDNVREFIAAQRTASL